MKKKRLDKFDVPLYKPFTSWTAKEKPKKKRKPKPYRIRLKRTK